jgi:hypothetical protein
MPTFYPVFSVRTTGPLNRSDAVPGMARALGPGTEAILFNCSTPSTTSLRPTVRRGPPSESCALHLRLQVFRAWRPGASVTNLKSVAVLPGVRAFMPGASRLTSFQVSSQSSAARGVLLTFGQLKGEKTCRQTQSECRVSSGGRGAGARLGQGRRLRGVPHSQSRRVPGRPSESGEIT